MTTRRKVIVLWGRSSVSPTLTRPRKTAIPDHGRPSMTPRPIRTATAPRAAQPPLDPVRLAEAHINPLTGLATDYLNHFNEAIMLLELLSVDPDCLEDFMSWQPMSYTEHFAASSFKHRDIAIAAYAAADPVARARLDVLADTMTDVLTATREALQATPLPPSTSHLATKTVAWLKPLVARAGAGINGTYPADSAAAAGDGEPQAAIDAVMER